MTKIPQDVMKAAESVIELHRATDGSALKRGDALIEYIARVILAERERCANVAENDGKAFSDARIFHGRSREIADLSARRIASAIRSGA